ncbi:MAG TPA: GNAT family N-acetyltransferase [Verrucomicrobiae bacterium]
MRVLDVRKAKVDDVEKLLPVVEQFYAHFGFAWDTEKKRRLLKEFIGRRDLGGLWCAEKEGRMVGYASIPFYFALEFDGRVGLLDELFVLPEFRGLGSGAHMLKEIMNELPAEGINRLRLEVDERHPEAATLYARLGFVLDGRQTWSRAV